MSTVSYSRIREPADVEIEIPATENAELSKSFVVVVVAFRCPLYLIPELGNLCMWKLRSPLLTQHPCKSFVLVVFRYASTRVRIQLYVFVCVCLCWKYLLYIYFIFLMLPVSKPLPTHFGL